jgi:hypothetical protein
VADLFGEYMTPAEFADLPSDAHHAVWAAHREGRVDGTRWPPRGGTVLVYNRAQVRKLLAATRPA